jgi:two-component system NarL family sensor kinase
MPEKTYSEEIFFLVLAGIVVFLVVIGLLVIIILYYQKKRFQHRHQLAAKDKEYAEQLLQSKLEMQEQTFTMISSEIHDNVGQILSLAKVQLNIIDQSGVLDKSLLKEAKESVGKALTDLRDIAKSLNSNRIQQIGLFESVQQELQRIQRAGIMNTFIELKGNEVAISDHKTLIIFRISQESLQNIIKHSDASKIEVVFNYQKDNLTITIADNGKGFDCATLNSKDGQGVQNIISRAALIKGTATIDSVPDGGTTIAINLPYE